jgi:uncharacterized repeat protein (TIGR03809 family)
VRVIVAGECFWVSFSSVSFPPSGIARRARMTIPFDASRYQQTLERWRVLAERRLEHMTHLYDTGRWRRYFNEEQFLAIVRDARACVDVWRKIAPEQATVAQLFAVPDEPVPVRTPPPPSPFAVDAQRSVA